MQELLEGKAEGEATLLAALVNKLGDVDKKVRRPITAVAWDRNQVPADLSHDPIPRYWRTLEAAIDLRCVCVLCGQVAPHASHLLRRVLSHHPVMKVVMAREVQQFLHRPNLQPRALYNGITFLDQVRRRHAHRDRESIGRATRCWVRDRPADRTGLCLCAQLILKRGDHELSMQLIKTYFQLFDVALKAGGNQHPPLLHDPFVFFRRNCVPLLNQVSPSRNRPCPMPMYTALT